MRADQLFLSRRLDVLLRNLPFHLSTIHYCKGILVGLHLGGRGSLFDDADGGKCADRAEEVGRSNRYSVALAWRIEEGEYSRRSQ